MNLPNQPALLTLKEISYDLGLSERQTRRTLHRIGWPMPMAFSGRVPLYHPSIVVRAREHRDQYLRAGIEAARQRATRYWAARRERQILTVEEAKRRANKSP